MPIIKCDYCNKDFNKRLDKIKISKNNFCSHECRVKGKFKNPNTICVNCGKIFKQTPYKIKRNKNNFCSKECQTIYYKNSYKTSGNITVIYISSPTYGLREVLIDTDDYERVKLYTWVLDFKSKSKLFYIRGRLNNKNIYMHRIIMNYSGNLVIDHINYNTLDNRKCNLRLLTRIENGFRP